MIGVPWTVYDLKRFVDRHGEEIFIQRECESTDKPMLWYKFDRQKNNVRYERDSAGILCTNLGRSAMLC